MSLGGPPRAVTIARVRAIEISLNWRWAPVLLLGTWLLAQNVLPARFPSWESSTTWLIAAAAVLAGEAALLLHELAHALTARWDGQRVTRIVFHGFRAVTHVDDCEGAPAHELLIALAGPATNIALAMLAACARVAFATQGPLDAFLLMLLLGNAAAAGLSLLPVGGSDGARALNCRRRHVALEAEVPSQRQDENDEDQEP
jgi:Zn-dependent protease